uniref:Fibrinogen C-terminal domain-containing protein n=1 Tax=Denticeps clupeoides TaxID=299321 RepID=A0AAY4CX40_9TELE
MFMNLDVRGPRPVEHGYKPDKCATEKEWPFCSDDDWGPKCPSGCRIQGLLSKTDHELLTKIEKIQRLLDEHDGKYRSTDVESKKTYEDIRERLTSDAGNDNKYMTLAEQLRQRIVEIKMKIDRQLRLLQSLKARVKEQIIEMQRLEVDIDIKLRACKGSCAGYAQFSVDKDSYVSMEKQMDHLEAMRFQSVETVSSLKMMKSRPLKDVTVPSIYKSGSTGEQTAYFTDVGQLKLTLEAEGSTAETAATVGKVPGTVNSHKVKCTKSVRKTVTHTKDGPVEKLEVVSGGGPGCEGIDAQTFLTAAREGKDVKGDGFTIKVTGGDRSITTISQGEEMPDLLTGSDFFRTLGTSFEDPLAASATKTSKSSSSSSSTKTLLTKTTKTSKSSSILGDDLGGFGRGDVDDDKPDIFARSVRPAGLQRTASEGKDCVDILQNHTLGAKSGLFKIKPAGSQIVVDVYCDQSTQLGGWVLVQQREDGSVNFNRTWQEYRDGFGHIDGAGRGEVWLGNQLLHLLTQEPSLLRVEMQDWEGKEAYAEYEVRVGSESEGFPLSVSSYIGDAGDALVQIDNNLGSFLTHEGMKFSTFDRDSDRWEENCAEMYGGGWWYNNCQSANLNGVYFRGGLYDPGTNIPYEIENGVVWTPFRPADYSLKVVRMKVRPADPS